LSKLRLVGLFLLGFLLVGGIIIGIKYRQLRSVPSHWQANADRLDLLPEEQKKAIAESFRNRVLGQWSRLEAGGSAQDIIDAMGSGSEMLGDTRTITIPFDELNIWLATEARGVMAQRETPMPRSIAGAMVDSDGNGNLILAVKYESKDITQIFSFTLDLLVDKDDRVVSRLISVHGGRLELPREAALSQFEKLLRGSADRGDPMAVLKILNGEPFGPVDIPIDPDSPGARDGRITGIVINDDSLQLTRTTIRRQATDP